MYFLSSYLCLFLFTHQIDLARLERWRKEGAADHVSPSPRKRKRRITRRFSPSVCFPYRAPHFQHFLPSLSLLPSPPPWSGSILTSPRRGRGWDYSVSFSGRGKGDRGSRGAPRLWSLPILCGRLIDTKGIFTKRFEKTKKSVGAEPTTKNHLTVSSPPNWHQNVSSGDPTTALELTSVRLYR